MSKPGGHFVASRKMLKLYLSVESGVLSRVLWGRGGSEDTAYGQTWIKCFSFTDGVLQVSDVTLIISTNFSCDSDVSTLLLCSVLWRG